MGSVLGRGTLELSHMVEMDGYLLVDGSSNLLPARGASRRCLEAWGLDPDLFVIPRPERAT